MTIKIGTEGESRRIAELDAEVERINDQLIPHEPTPEEVAQLTRERLALAVEALVEFGEHQESCPSRWYPNASDEFRAELCDCGFSAYLDELVS